MLVWLLLLTSCASTGAAYVNLDEREPLPAVAAAEVIPLRVAVAAILSPQGTAESYGNLASYLGARLERPVELVQRRTYAEVNELVAAGQVDLAFVCTSAYVAGHDQFGMELLVAPEIDGQHVYYSVLIVPDESAARDIADLQGKVFAFTDPMSFSGRTYPTFLVQQLGEVPEHFFRRTFFTYSHDRAIEAVAAGVADGAAVDSLVLDHALRRKPALAQQIRALHRSPPFGIPPVVVPPNLSPRQKVRIQEILLNMHDDPEGRPILAELGMDRFVLLEDQAYAGVRELVRQMGGEPWQP